jgi:hypothetical protein
MPGGSRVLCLRLLFGPVLGLISLCTSPAEAKGAKIRLAKRLWGTGEVHLVEGHRDRLLERYREPISVESTEVSLDGRLAFVWYREARLPLQIAIYDLRSMKRTARFSPGFGGELHFTPGGNIVHRWGCGSNCAELSVYDVHGKHVLDAGGTGVEVSQTRRFAVIGPSFFAADEAVVVYDLDSGQSVFTRRPRPSDNILLDEVRWDEGHGVVRLRLERLGGREAQQIVVPLGGSPSASHPPNARRSAPGR